MNPPSTCENPGALTRYARLSVLVALLTLGLKFAAYYVTGSIGLLSDAMESIVNLVGGLMAWAMLRIAAQPEDRDHAHGHGKAEYFSSGVEGSLIIIAAISIIWSAIPRLLSPRPIEEAGLGLLISSAASALNLVAALWILRAGKKAGSITLEANAKHLLTDVWTSVGVIGAIALVSLTGWQRLDPIVALLVAANILWTGFGIVRRSVGGLMDASLDPAELKLVEEVLQGYIADKVSYHALRTRRSGAQRFVSVHVLVPGDWSVQKGHELLERIEEDIRLRLPGVSVLTHLEPSEDPASFADQNLLR